MADAANSFLIPQYGSVVILNPPPSSDPDTVYHLHPAILGAPFRLFKQHLLDLLALPNYSSRELDPIPRSYAEPPYAFHQPMPPWEIEQIYRMRTKENSDEARKTLAGIVRLVKKIGEMKVESGVRDKVLGAVDRLERVSRLACVSHFAILMSNRWTQRRTCEKPSCCHETLSGLQTKHSLTLP